MKIGFVGLGIMGKPMAKNLLKTGYKLVVYDINPAPVKELAAAGAEAASSAKEVAQKTDVLITMLPNSPHVKAAVMGPNGVLEGAKPGMILLDMSSIARSQPRKSQPKRLRRVSRCWTPRERR